VLARGRRLVAPVARFDAAEPRDLALPLAPAREVLVRDEVLPRALLPRVLPPLPPRAPPLALPPLAAVRLRARALVDAEVLPRLAVLRPRDEPAPWLPRADDAALPPRPPRDDDDDDADARVPADARPDLLRLERSMM